MQEALEEVIQFYKDKGLAIADLNMSAIFNSLNKKRKSIHNRLIHYFE
jgi:hypothetical protein